jgi:hypothetical protein
MTARARTLAVLVAYVCLAAQASAVVHAIFVRHATCPTHGELTHAGPAPSAAQKAPPASTSVSANAASVEDGDEHCLVTALRREGASLRVPILVITSAPASRPAALAPPAIVVPPVPLLVSAPKTSPPSA